jgi:hypothetical protein
MYLSRTLKLCFEGSKSFFKPELLLRGSGMNHLFYFFSASEPIRVRNPFFSDPLSPSCERAKKFVLASDGHEIETKAGLPDALFSNQNSQFG